MHINLIQHEPERALGPLPLPFPIPPQHRPGRPRHVDGVARPEAQVQVSMDHELGGGGDGGIGGGVFPRPGRSRPRLRGWEREERAREYPARAVSTRRDVPLHAAAELADLWFLGRSPSQVRSGQVDGQSGIRFSGAEFRTQ